MHVSRLSLTGIPARCAVIMAALLCPASLAAQDPAGSDRGPLAITGGVGTFGLTVEGDYRISDRFGLRGVLGYGSVSYSDTSDGEEYEGDFEAFGAGVLADYYPFGSGFRISGGFMVPDYRADLVGRNITIGALTSDIEVDIEDRSSVAPALAIGYGRNLGRGFSISSDVGLIYVGGFDINARDPSGTFTQEQVDDETSDIRDDFNSADIVPYAKITIGFSF